MCDLTGDGDMADRHALLTEILTLPASFPAADGAPLAAMLDHLKCRDDGHGERVGRLAAQLGELLDSGIEASVLYLAGRLHDAGKLMVPDCLLNHPGAFTSQLQTDVMRLHPTLGLGALLHLSDEVPPPVHGAVLLHHERFDGKGYPLGVAGQSIPLAARIIGLVDVVDALLSVRPYKSAWSVDRVKAFLRDNAGKAFDPQLVSVALRHFDKLLLARESRNELGRTPIERRGKEESENICRSGTALSG